MTGPELLIVRVEEAGSGTSAEYAFVHSPVRVGRSARNDVPISHPYASAWHGLIEFDAGGVRYTDLGSTNGSRVRGAPVAPRQAVLVPRGADVEIGGVRLTFPARVPHSEPRTNATASALPGTGPDVPSGPPAAGRLTALMQQLARGPGEEAERSWKHVLFPGAVIGPFEMIRELGRGGFGVVFEARDRRLGRLVAFKAVRPGRNSIVTYRQQRLQLEAEAVASLTHPNIVSLFDVGSSDGSPYLIFELLRGETLFDRTRRGPLPVGEALEVAIQVGWALDHAHAAGVVHRDLKPSNVFLCAGGPVKVLDFGIADVLGGGDLRGVGTPAYMAPEQWVGRAQDARTDVFGAAVMLYETMSGHLPYRAGKERSEVLDAGATPRLDGVALPPGLRDLLRRALDPDPARRPAGGHEWVQALVACQRQVEGTVELAAGGASRAATRRTPVPPPWRAAILGVAALVVAGLALWAVLR